jgi:hypothetical protein
MALKLICIAILNNVMLSGAFIEIMVLCYINELRHNQGTVVHEF